MKIKSILSTSWFFILGIVSTPSYCEEKLFFDINDEICDYITKETSYVHDFLVNVGKKTNPTADTRFEIGCSGSASKLRLDYESHFSANKDYGQTNLVESKANLNFGKSSAHYVGGFRINARKDIHKNFLHVYCYTSFDHGKKLHFKFGWYNTPYTDWCHHGSVTISRFEPVVIKVNKRAIKDKIKIEVYYIKGH